MSNTTVDEFTAFLQKELQQEPIIERVEAMAREGKPSTQRENVFVREFLAPTIRTFFQQAGSSEEEMKNGLGVEGLSISSGFGSSPASKAKHLFTKSDVIKSNAPDSWFCAKDKHLTDCHACPDFAIRKPLLPVSILGEVKYLTSSSPRSAVREMYNASRQAVFYLGAFNGASDAARYDSGRYESAMIVIADASGNEALSEGRKLLKKALLDRYGTETGIYFLPITLI